MPLCPLKALFSHSRKAFTLIELLVVVAIIAILSVVVLLTLNPAQLLMQSRDSNRISDMSTVNEAIGVYLASGATGSVGNASTTYISIPDPLATSTAGDQCQGLGLPSLPASTTYQCAASSTYRNTNGAGWIPVNFSSITFGAPLSVLPVDPVNTTSSGEYYEYIPGTSSAGTYELLARLESQKYTSSGGTGYTDGGYSNQYDEVGKDLSLALNMPTDLNRISSIDYLGFDQSGLVGYWPLNEGGGATAIDQSGNGNNGVWTGTQAGTSGYYSAGKVGSWTGYFNGSNDNLSISNASNKVLPGSNQPFSISLWLNTNNLTGLSQNAEAIIGNDTYLTSGFRLAINGCNVVCKFYFWTTEDGGTLYVGGITTAVINTWYFVTATYNGSLGSLYLNGSLESTSTGTYIGNTNTVGIGNSYSFGKSPWSGSSEDLRVYNRALSAQEVQAMYNGGM